MIPEDSRVEIDAKINAGYFTNGKQCTTAELKEIKGRGWEKWEDVVASLFAWSSQKQVLTPEPALNPDGKVHSKTLLEPDKCDGLEMGIGLYYEYNEVSPVIPKSSKHARFH